MKPGTQGHHKNPLFSNSIQVMTYFKLNQSPQTNIKTNFLQTKENPLKHNRNHTIDKTRAILENLKASFKEHLTRLDMTTPINSLTIQSKAIKTETTTTTTRANNKKASRWHGNRRLRGKTKDDRPASSSADSGDGRSGLRGQRQLTRSSSLEHAVMDVRRWSKSISQWANPTRLDASQTNGKMMFRWFVWVLVGYLWFFRCSFVFFFNRLANVAEPETVPCDTRSNPVRRR